MPELRINVRTHHFVVRDISLRARPAILEFRACYHQYEPSRGRFSTGESAVMCTYGTRTQNWREFRWHINQLPHFMEMLKKHYLTGPMVEVVEDPLPVFPTIELPIFEQWQPRDYQLPVLKFMNEVPPPPFPVDYKAAKLVSIQTGKGKSFCGMNSMSHHGHRAAVIIRPMFMDKWLEDIVKTFDIDKKDILVVQGGKALMTLLHMARDGDLHAKVIIISNKTFQNYLKMYELHHENLEEQGYVIPPDQFFAALGIGYRLIDEVHLDFHLNFKIDLYTHGPVSISLSATLTSNDAFMERMYSVAYPQPVRYEGEAYHKYVNARALIYGLERPDRIRYKNGGMYSHNVFEQSILKYAKTTHNYLEMFKSVVDIDFLPDARKGDRILVFCASIDMCTVVTNYLKGKYPDLDVRRYVEKDPYENAIEPDIIVSTLLSAGTGLDIPNLRVVFMSTAMMSKSGNIQGMGRLRYIEGQTLRFVYSTCQDIPKQMAYHEEKKVLLKDRAKTYRADYYRIPI